jgi:hypothetical protein
VKLTKNIQKMSNSVYAVEEKKTERVPSIANSSPQSTISWYKSGGHDNNNDDNQQHQEESDPMKDKRTDTHKRFQSKKPSCIEKCCSSCYTYWSRCDTVHNPYPSSSTKCCDRCSWTFMQCVGGPLQFFLWPFLIPLLLRLFADEKACPYQPACVTPLTCEEQQQQLPYSLHCDKQLASPATASTNTTVTNNDTAVCSTGHYNTTTTCSLVNLTNAYTDEWNGGEWFLWSNLLEIGFEFKCKYNV